MAAPLLVVKVEVGAGVEEMESGEEEMMDPGRLVSLSRPDAACCCAVDGCCATLAAGNG